MRFKGIIAKEVYENSLDRIQDLRLKTSFLQRQYDCGDILITPIAIIGAILLYYDLRVKETGYSLEALEQETSLKNDERSG